MLNTRQFHDLLHRMGAQPEVAIFTPPWCRVAEAERRLYAVVLDDAIHEYQLCRDRDDDVSRAACTRIRRWLNGAPAKVTFGMVCEALGLDMEMVRKGVLACLGS